MNWWSPVSGRPDPRPRDVPLAYAPFRWPVAGIVSLEPGAAPHPINLANLLSNRRSHQPGGRPTLEAVGALLWQVARTLDTASSPFGFELERRPTPSAGAIHPIHILVQEPGRHDWARYDGRSHRLERVADVDGFLAGLDEHAYQAAGTDTGTLMAFAAEPGRTSAKYEDSESLVWRDAGVLQGILCAVAPAVGLQVCLLGPTGDPWVSQLAEQGQLRGVGLACVVALDGRRMPSLEAALG